MNLSVILSYVEARTCGLHLIQLRSIDMSSRFTLASFFYVKRFYSSSELTSMVKVENSPAAIGALQAQTSPCICPALGALSLSIGSHIMRSPSGFYEDATR